MSVVCGAEAGQLLVAGVGQRGAGGLCASAGAGGAGERGGACVLARVVTDAGAEGIRSVWAKTRCVTPHLLCIACCETVAACTNVGCGRYGKGCE